jgi:periplasmic protein CpxP/Spy
MQRRNRFLFALIVCLVSSGLAAAQGPGGPGSGPGAPGHDGWGRPPMERTFHDDHFGRWWHNPHLAQEIGLSDDQKKKMDDIFQQHRLNLVDLNANLEKEELLLKPMIGADQPNEDEVLAQIDKVAQARAELEKANARMLFDVRRTLTPDQWQKLKTLHEEHEAQRQQLRDGQDGSSGWHRHGQPGQGPPVAPMPPPPGTMQPQGGAPPQGDAQDGPPPGDGAPATPAVPQF